MSFQNKFGICLFFLFFQLAVSQEKYNEYSLDINYGLGKILPFGDLEGYGQNAMISLNKHTFGKKEWERAYNFPSYGVAFMYQNNENPIIGDVYSLMLHYTHYFFNRKITLKIADGLSVATNPRDVKDNPKNNVLTSTLLNGFYISVQYKKENVWDRIGFQAGASFTHYSNGATKLVNNGLNTWFLQAGLNYSLGKKNKEYMYEGTSEVLDKKIHYNLFYRDGFNQNLTETDYDYLATISFFADKRLDIKGAVQFGGDFFFSGFLRNLIEKRNQNTSYKGWRMGIFAGYRIIMDKVSFPIQFGYYVYNPTKYESNFYQRIGAQYPIFKHINISIALKTHLARAEAIEYGIGIHF